MPSKPIRMLPAYEVFNSCTRTQRNHVRDGYFFASKLQTWFVFVKDKGEAANGKVEEQLSLFG
ncbi:MULTISPECIES: hypothetical protein [Vibrio]|uniref:hypothetical protein n=1 Tax=Vibrio TaxID=662 RepID=UPI00111BD8FD|nr:MULTISPECIES: hypothetical protein [Vibrio]MCG3724806.1 hypothetical protein [Vibrio cincinnatiensis]GHY69481.1 hypothetical protein VCSRO74_0441 [Vibrio cholerae]MBY8135305.1 hypothetical protein [Vibrio fluvialis]MCG6380287.1 hypothetical protein [Vibrio fluvialis]HDG1716773.1 hypothetical protein [Vibrio cholerae]